LKHDKVHYGCFNYLFLRGDRCDMLVVGSGGGYVGRLDHFEEGEGQVTAELRETLGVVTS
jgi:hypothetical protein